MLDLHGPQLSNNILPTAPFCRDLTRNLVLDKIVKHATASSVGSTTVLACGALDWFATNGLSDAPGPLRRMNPAKANPTKRT